VSLGTGFSPRMCQAAGATDLIYAARFISAGPLRHRRFSPASRTFGPATTVVPAGARERFACSRDAAGDLLVSYWTGSGQRLWNSLSGQSAPLNTETPFPLPAIAVTPGGGGWLAYRNDQNQVRLQLLGDAAQPALGKAIVVGPVSGTVKVRRRGSRTFTTLRAGQAVPPGSELDTTRGTVAVTS